MLISMKCRTQNLSLPKSKTEPSLKSYSEPSETNRRYWYFRGLRGVLSVPAFILMLSFVGFGAFCREVGMTVGQAAFSTATIWALPSQVVLAGAVAGGSSLLLVMIAVALASIRLTPMVAAWVPVVRGPQSTRFSLICMSHFVAVTAWIISMARLPEIPRTGRASYFVGFASSLTVCNTFITVFSFWLAGEISAEWRGALFYLTPIYFLTSLTGAAKIRSDQLAMVFGLVLGPAIYLTGIQLDLMWTGLIGGTTAFVIVKFSKRWRAAK